VADAKIEETHVPIASIHLDPQYQMREKVNRETVSEYAELIRGNKGKWPFVEPVKLVRVRGKKGEQPTLVLVDGWHRIAAAKEAEEDHVLAVIIDGTAEAAFKEALGANSQHGLPRSNGDKRKAVAAALERYASWDNRKIAKLVGVSHTMVNDARKRLEAASSEPGMEGPSTSSTGAENKVEAASSVAPGPGAPALPKVPTAAAGASSSPVPGPVAGDIAVGADNADGDLLDDIMGEAQEFLDRLSGRVPASCHGQWYAFLARYASLKGESPC
jgi:hypothetical protein